MTDTEKQILTKLAEAYNLFIELDHYNRNDVREWVAHTHALQNIVMARDAVRNEAEFFTKETL